MATDNIHDASGSASGYLYQMNWALSDLLLKGMARPDQAVTIEGDDDIVWAKQTGSAQELIQTKAHGAGSSPGAGLGDMGVDLWKTFRIWLTRDDAFDPNGPDLTLVTTSVASDGSAAAHLVPANSGSRVRDVDRADELLELAARDSVSTSTEGVRQAYLAVDRAQRVLFLNRVQILDAELGPADVFETVRQRLGWALPTGGSGPEDSFLEQLWGWWLRVCVQLLAGERYQVNVMEVQAFVRELRDEYGKGALKTTVHIDDVTPEHIELYAGRQFVTQLKWVNYSPESLRLAIIDYHRAIAQETYWLDHQLLGVVDLQRFEANIRHEWQRAFAQMVEDLSDLPLDGEALEQAKSDAGRKFARRVLDSSEVVLRDRYHETFFAKGKRHTLADIGTPDSSIGWHPDFRSRLAGLLEPAR